MSGYPISAELGWLLLGAAVLIPMILVAYLPRRSIKWLLGFWLLLPVFVYWALATVEFATRPPDVANTFENAWLGFFLLSALLLLPWLMICAVGFGLGWLWRRLRAPTEPETIAVQPLVETPSIPLAPVAFQRPDPSPQMAALRTIILDHAQRYGIAEAMLPTLGYSLDGACPYVFVHNGRYHFAAEERGAVIFDQSTEDVDELLYWVFDDASFNVASQEAAKGLLHYDDYGKRLLARRDALLESINPAWQKRSLTDPASRLSYYRKQARAVP